MPKRQVEYIIKADSKQAFANSTKLLKQAEKMGNQIENAGNKGKKGFEDMGRSGAEGLSKMTSLITGAGGLLMAYKLLTSEMELQKKIQADAAMAQMTQNQANQTLLRNLPRITRTETGTLLKDIAAISKETGVSRTALTLGMAQAASASGGNIPASLDAIKTAARFMPEQPSEIPQFAGSLLDIQKLPGVKGAMQALGVLQFVGGQSRVVDPGMQARNIPGALTGMGKAGATGEEAAEMFAWLTAQGVDVKGEPSRTAGINFAVKIRDFFGKRKIEGPVTMGERIRHLQGKPALAQEFLKEMGGEVRFKPAFEELFKPGTVGFEAFEDIQEAIPSLSEMGPAGKLAIERRKFAPFEKTAKLKRVLDVAIETKKLEDEEAGVTGIFRPRMKELLPLLGGSAIGSKLKSLLFEGKTFAGTQDTVGTAIEMITDEQRKLLVGEKFLDPLNPFDTGVKPWATWGGKIEPTEADASTGRLLGSIYRILREIRDADNKTASNTIKKETFDKAENE